MRKSALKEVPHSKATIQLVQHCTAISVIAKVLLDIGRKEVSNRLSIK